jgi:uncharacterized protein
LLDGESMTRFAIQRVRPTAEALELIEQLTEQHGPLALHSDQCDDGSPIRCLTKAELLPGDGDVKLGEIGGAALYADEDAYERCGRPAIVVDVEPAAGRRFSLEGLEEVRFVARWPAEISNERGLVSSAN